MIRVRMPSGEWQEIEASSVRQLVRLLDIDLSGMSVVINGDIMPDAIYEPLPQGAEVHFLPTISGGL